MKCSNIINPSCLNREFKQKSLLWLNKTIQYSIFVYHNNAHLQLLSCLRLASAHLLAAVQSIISLPPFLCSCSSLGPAQGREWGREGGKETSKKGRASLLWHRHKGIPSAGWARPLSHCRLAPRHTLVHTYRCLHGGRRNGPLRETRGRSKTCCLR